MDLSFMQRLGCRAGMARQSGTNREQCSDPIQAACVAVDRGDVATTHAVQPWLVDPRTGQLRSEAHGRHAALRGLQEGAVSDNTRQAQAVQAGRECGQHANQHEMPTATVHAARKPATHRRGEERRGRDAPVLARPAPGSIEAEPRVDAVVSIVSPVGHCSNSELPGWLSREPATDASV